MKYISYISLFISSTCLGQVTVRELKTIDSLKQIIKNAQHDSTAINALIAWDYIIYVSDPKTDLIITKKIDGISTKNLRRKLNKKEKYFFMGSRAFALNSLGLIYHEQGNYDKAIKVYSVCLNIREKINDIKGIGAVLNNIGLLQQSQGNYELALNYFKRSLKLREQLKDSSLIAETLNNVAIGFQTLGDFKTALKVHFRSLKIKEQTGDKVSISTSFNNIGLIYLLQGKYTPAMNYFKRCLEMKEEMNDLWGISVAHYNIGKIFGFRGNYKEALLNSKIAFDIAQKNNFALQQKDAAEAIYIYAEKTGQYKTANEMFELFIATRDSIYNKESEKEIIRHEFKYRYEKQVLADSIKHAAAGKLKDAQLAQQKARAEEQTIELNSKRFQQLLLFSGLAILLVFTGFIYNRFRITKKQKSIIQEKQKETNRQKEIIEEKQKEIIDSIHYAKRIQTALLPSEKYINRELGKLKNDLF